MQRRIKTVSVVGSGIMGSQIAGHLAGCGFRVLLLDLNRDIVLKGLERLKKSKPTLIYTNKVLERIEIGTIESDLESAADCDWIVEVVPERLEIKQDLFSKLEKFIKDDSIITSNTSGISLKLLTEGRSDKFRKSFLITHFFNPVRYMKLVEVVSGPETDRNKLDAIKNILHSGLGKGVVSAKDTPGFIANRIGVYSVMSVIRKTFQNKWPIDLVDQVLGKAGPFARSAVFRTADIVGLDTLLLVAKNEYEMCVDDPFRDGLKPHSVLEELVSHGDFGTKTGAGFYKKSGDKILVLDNASKEYRPKKIYDYETLKKAKKIKSPAERLKLIFESDDESAKIAKDIIKDIITYSVSVKDEISDSVRDIDNAMKWGYNWEMGPFEMWNASEIQVNGKKPEILHEEIQVQPNVTFFRNKNGCIESNSSSSLVDIGGKVVVCEFHSKMNAIDPDIISMLNKGMDFLDSGKFDGMIITNDSENFSVGANLFMIAMAISNKAWDQIENLVKAFQDCGMRMRFSKKPVVAAPFGRTLGGGCEISMAAGNCVSAAETYCGLVELGVGLIPAGGGCKNLILNMDDFIKSSHNPRDKIWFSADDGGPFPKAAKGFEAIAAARVSISAHNAVELGYFAGDKTIIVLDRERLLEKSKEHIQRLMENYGPPVYREDIHLPGRGGQMALVAEAERMHTRGLASEYDLFLARNLAYVLAGGNIATDHKASEQDILDMEREVFLKLCGEQKTAERIQHILTTGKPLSN